METFETLREEAEVALRDLLAARPALMAAVESATRQAFDAAKKFENFALRVARGSRHGGDAITPGVARLLDQARRERDAAAVAAERMKRELKNNDWEIEVWRAELTQLELVEHPPVEGRGPVVEVVKRKPPTGFDVVADNIEFPSGKPPPDSAA
jgi:hypothetical protein